MSEPRPQTAAGAFWVLASYFQCLGLTEDQLHRISLILAEPRKPEAEPPSKETWRDKEPLL